ncbi:hypothetical protein EI067_15370 [Mycobacterium paragordonae]|uniref:hypothetical protein n=1 Tax=Mycobacterium paragordonae TaxID=1389713 RepID=UPI00106236C7|nr:hypothetical protein [Mycobacterium paragordonae]TDK96481.1 hypothetical protein EI067_15370 [Mycobacterium paragordonae]
MLLRAGATPDGAGFHPQILQDGTAFRRPHVDNGNATGTVIAFIVGLTWDNKPGKKAAAVLVQSEFENVLNVDQWPAMLDWVIDRNVRFKQAVEAVGGIAFFA